MLHAGATAMAEQISNRPKPQPAAPEWAIKLIGDPSDRLTIVAFADANGVTENTVRRWIREERITAYRLGGRIYLDRSSVERFLAGDRVGGPAALAV